MSVETHLTIDVLHCLHLGVLMTYCKVVIWLLINGGAWGQHGSQEETFHAAVLAIRVELNQFYSARHRAHPTEGLTRISSFRHKTLGDPSDPKLRTKGAETWGFLLFLVLHCTAKFSSLGDAGLGLLEAGRALVKMVQDWQSAPAVLTPAQIRASFASWNKFLLLTNSYEEMMIPKRHLVAHLLSKLWYHGNPRRYAVWQDESLNRSLKKCCRGISQISFEPHVLLRVPELLRSGQKRSRE